MTDERVQETLPEKSSFATDDLKILVDGTSRKLIIKDRFGVDHELVPLTVRDIIDFEKQVGTSLLAIFNANLGIEHIAFLLYCSLRKEGCSPEDIKKRKYRYSQDDVQEMFDASFLTTSIPLFTRLLDLSGFGKRKEANPPVAPAGGPPA